MKSNWDVFIGACVGAVVGFAVGQHMGGGSAWKGPQTAQAQATPQKAAAAQPPPGSEQIFKVRVGDAPVFGPADAKVTIVEWSDFQCPFCGRVVETLKQIERTYGDDVRIAFKHNPLPMHANAPYAAKASIAAQRQGKFWPMHDKLFEANQSRQPDSLAKDKVDQMARDLGLDMERYQKDVADSTVTDIIVSDQAEARQLAANSTPHFFINGARVAGAMPFESFKAVIDRELARANTALASGVAKKDLYEYLVKDGQTKMEEPAAPAPPPSARNVDPGEQSPSLGNKTAKVTIVEWSDFQCPFCGRVEPTLKQIRDTYGKDVRIVWRNQPLSFHPNAMPAAKAAMAAAKQGKFWQMHDRMFENQQSLSDDNYEKWAREIGLNVAKWKADKESPEVAAQIQKDASYGSQVGADGTPAFFVNGKFISGAMPFETFKSVIDEQLAKANDALKRGVKPSMLYQTVVEENVKAAGAVAAAGGQPSGDERAHVEAGNSPSRGPKNAPVTIVEWSDFQCPYCSRVEPTLKQIADEYKNKVRIVWKNQPLPFHPNAMPAAEAAMAAYEQGNDKFWAMHDKLFENQQALSPERYEQIAKEIGLDLAKFKASVESHRAQASIQADMSAGSAVGAGGTPTFFVNGRKLVGAMPFDSFKQVIDAELQAKVANK